MAKIKEWQKFFVRQYKSGNIDQTIEAMGKLPRFIFQEFEGLEQVYTIAKNIEKWGDKEGLDFIEKTFITFTEKENKLRELKNVTTPLTCPSCSKKMKTEIDDKTKEIHYTCKCGVGVVS